VIKPKRHMVFHLEHFSFRPLHQDGLANSTSVSGVEMRLLNGVKGRSVSISLV
jgi:hypothetical protein